jgi:hypothetical protein
MKKSGMHAAQGELQSADETPGEHTGLTMEQLDSVAGGFSILGAIAGFLASVNRLLNR